MKLIHFRLANISSFLKFDLIFVTLLKCHKLLNSKISSINQRKPKIKKQKLPAFAVHIICVYIVIN